MSEAAHVGLWQTLRLQDPERMLAWFGVVGFVEHAVHRDPQSGTVQHLELLWPGGGGLMAGPERDTPAWPARPGTAATYLVCEDPDGVVEAAVAAGADVIDPVRDQDYGGRTGTLRDPEGNLWSVGSYRPG